MTTFEEFRQLAEHANVIPVVQRVLADTETPVSVYLRLRERSTQSFLLESVDGGDAIARYSFLGADPFMVARIEGSRLRLEPRHDDVSVLPSLVDPDDHPIEGLKKIFRFIRTPQIPGVPRFTGGAVGFFGFETVALMERLRVVEREDGQLPDGVLLFCDTVLIFDNVLRQVFLISNGFVPFEGRTETHLRSEYDKAVAEVRRLEELLRRPVDPELAAPRTVGDRTSAPTQERFEGWVRAAQDYIRAGDIFQVVLSQEVQQPFDGDPFTLYRMLRRLNPSPYMYHLQLGESAIIGASPEMLVRVDGRSVATRPIAGTRRRGATPSEDEVLAAELLADVKERAEHLMLVDLGRNDLGRICSFGTVSVSAFMQVEFFSHVMHLVSNVRGALREDVSALDALMACFPAGTLSGAPKLRALEIIAELERDRRGVYGGAIAYLDFSGNMDSCIAIRTMVLHEGRLHLRSGAGIVLDSRPAREFEETQEKLAATLRTLDDVSLMSRKGGPTA
ncbi:MAG: anthranilate synthase component I [Bacteroidetes bacterium]|jgi:anthranilate synthase component 1|nr:anthranilate synthase component I [Bacteroidota bacterium]